MYDISRRLCYVVSKTTKNPKEKSKQVDRQICIQYIVENFSLLLQISQNFLILLDPKKTFLLQRCSFYKSAVSSKNITFVVIFDCRACYLRGLKVGFPPQPFKIENIFVKNHENGPHKCRTTQRFTITKIRNMYSEKNEHNIFILSRSKINFFF